MINTFKYLGVTLDSKLSFSDHIGNVQANITKFAGILFKSKNLLTPEARLKFYYSFVYPHLSYNIQVWGSTHNYLVNRLLLVQKRIIRNIAGESYLASTSPLFKKFSVLKVPDIFTYHVCIYMFKSIRGDRFNVPHNLNTRNRHLAHPTRHRLATCQRAISHTGPAEWNSLPQRIRDIESHGVFKREVRFYLLGKC